MNTPLIDELKWLFGNEWTAWQNKTIDELPEPQRGIMRRLREAGYCAISRKTIKNKKI